MREPKGPQQQPVLPLTRERILQAALAFADANGIESLSMRKLAGDLGVEAMSLYNHVKNKDEIIDSVVDMVVGEIDLPHLEVDWKDAMRQRARSAHEVLLRHPWVTLALVSRASAGPAMLRYIDTTLGCLREAGFSFEEADRIWNAMDNHIYGYTLQELNFPFAEPEYANAAQEFVEQTSIDEYPYFRQLTEMIISREYDGVHNFDFGLELILDGLERFLEHR